MFLLSFVKSVFTWILENWKIIAVALIAAAVFYSGTQYTQTKWDKATAKLVAEQLKASKENQAIISGLQETKNVNTKEIERLAANNHALWMRLPKTPCSGLNTTSGSQDASAGSGELFTEAEKSFNEFTDGLGAEAERADKIVEQCRVVIDWAKSKSK